MTDTKERKLKLYTTSIKSINDDEKSIRFQVSDDSVDRYGEKVDQGWNLKNFLKNPIALWNHRSGYDMQPEDVMGNWGDFETKGGKTFATLTFDQGNEKAMFVYGQYKRGFLKAVSVGFIPHTLEFEDDVPVLKDNELLEISPVGIPANANALALAFKSGEVPRKDAVWMERSMREAADNLQEQLTKNAPDGEEKHVEEVKDQLKSITELITQLGEKVTAIDTDVKTINTELTEVKGAVAELKPAETAEPTTDPDDTKTETGDPSKTTDDPAKGGDNDQPGAAADEFDEDAELTPELQAQIDQEFEAASADSNDDQA
ncbi:HK97 family phage prohead protease [Mycolicibacterium neoaurum]|uniref:HK97 family phage prohead protease n=1 Tax=Mycolicibacterium neoaurum TaxID=1795 RepID=UPI001F4D18F1|nr:HK97 family phage prohead protease [Mycolicibacterium neoaurum]